MSRPGARARRRRQGRRGPVALTWGKWRDTHGLRGAYESAFERLTGPDEQDALVALSEIEALDERWYASRS